MSVDITKCRNSNNVDPLMHFGGECELQSHVTHFERLTRTHGTRAVGAKAKSNPLNHPKLSYSAYCARNRAQHSLMVHARVKYASIVLR